MTTEAQPEEQIAAEPVQPAAGWRRWFAVGAGVGIEIREKELQVTIARVRPSETGVLGAATVTDYRTRPAAEWGTELASFLKKLGAGHIAATVLLPRSDVIVRLLHLPGVARKDLEAAIRLQVDTLHPFAEDDVYFGWSLLGKTGHVLIGIARRETVQHYSSLFAEAGIKIAGFTFSASAIYSALRLITVPPAGFVAVHSGDGEVEVYGESEARPLFSATFSVAPERAASLARAELRLPETEVLPLSTVLPRPAFFPDHYDPSSGALEPNVLSYATGLAGACPWLSLQTNLLPPELRRASSRLRLIPTFALAGILAVLLILLAVQSSWADKRYLGVLQHEIDRFDPIARRVEGLDKQISAVRSRTQALDDFRRRAKQDMDALNEITKLIPAPGWVASLDLDRTTVQLGGEAEQAATLLKIIDSSPLFEKSEFTMPINRAPTGELFRIRAQRQYPAPGTQQAQPAGTAPSGRGSVTNPSGAAAGGVK
jgi:Tfp pilus assembly protein PilN